MAETRYGLGYKDIVRFAYDDCRYSCLCTFPYNYVNKQFGIGTVESLALLGAALCLHTNKPSELVKDKYSDEYVIPDCLPEWIRNEIRRNCGDYPEKFDGYEYDPDYTQDEEEANKLLLKRYKEIVEWYDSQIKEIECELIKDKYGDTVK